MADTRLLRTDAGAGRVLNWSSALAIGTGAATRATTRESFVLQATATTGLARSAAPPAPRRTNNRAQRQLQLKAGAAGPTLRQGAPAAPAFVAPPAAPAVPNFVAPDESPAAPTAPVEEARPPLLKKYSMHIDALDNYELLRFIPVTIEPLGERVFVAEAADLNLSITGQTAEDAVQLLKELLIRVYEGNRSKRHQLDTERRRQQRTLETYIGRPKGTWHWA